MEIKSEVQHISAFITRQRTDGMISANEGTKQIPTFPAKTLAELNLIEDWLSQEKENEQTLVSEYFNKHFYYV